MGRDERANPQKKTLGVGPIRINEGLQFVDKHGRILEAKDNVVISIPAAALTWKLREVTPCTAPGVKANAIQAIFDCMLTMTADQGVPNQMVQLTLSHEDEEARNLAFAQGPNKIIRPS